MNAMEDASTQAASTRRRRGGETPSVRVCGSASMTPGLHGSTNGRAMLGRWLFLYRVDAIWIEGDVVLDLGDRDEGGLVGPHGILRAFPSDGNAVVGAVALVGTVGDVVRPLQQRHVHILARDVVDRRIRFLAQRQRLSGVGDDTAGDGHDDPRRARLAWC